MEEKEVTNRRKRKKKKNIKLNVQVRAQNRQARNRLYHNIFIRRVANLFIEHFHLYEYIFDNDDDGVDGNNLEND